MRQADSNALLFVVPFEHTRIVRSLSRRRLAWLFSTRPESAQVQSPMKYSLRSLMIVLLVLPPILASGLTIASRLLAERETQTLPQGWPAGGRDEIQYFAPGPEFKLSREAAAKKPLKQEVKRSEESSR
jgi:hypothetical protein